MHACLGCLLGGRTAAATLILIVYYLSVSQIPLPLFCYPSMLSSWAYPILLVRYFISPCPSVSVVISDKDKGYFLPILTYKYKTNLHIFILCRLIHIYVCYVLYEYLVLTHSLRAQSQSTLLIAKEVCSYVRLGYKSCLLNCIINSHLISLAFYSPERV